MRPIRVTLMSAVLFLATACGAAPTGSQGDAGQAAQSAGTAAQSAGTAGKPAPASSAAAPSVAQPSATPPADSGEPDEAEARVNAARALAILTPPNATEEFRQEGPFELAVSFDSSETFESLVEFYLDAIPASGLQVTEDVDDFPGTREWKFVAEGYEGALSLGSSESGYRVTFFILGTPPAGPS